MRKLQTVLVEGADAQLWDLADLKRHLRVLHASEDDLIEAYAAAAAEAIDGLTGCLQISVLNKTYRDIWSDPADVGVLRLDPVVSVSSVTLVLDDLSEVALDASLYYLTPEAKGARLSIETDAFAGVTLSDRPGSIRCEYVAGMAVDAQGVPKTIAQAMRLLVGHFYANREGVAHLQSGKFDELPIGARALLAPYRRYGVEAWSHD